MQANNLKPDHKIPQEEVFELQSVQTLKGVGPGVAAKLLKLGISRVGELLFHLPIRYEDRTRIVPIGSLSHGQQAVVEGEIEHCEIKFGARRKGRSRRSLVCYLADGTGGIVLRFFYFNASQKKKLEAGARIRCFGDVRSSAMQLEMVHPEYQPIVENNPPVVEDSLTPVYPKTEGIHQIQLRKLISQVFNLISAGNIRLIELVPDEVINTLGFSNLLSALQYVHYPPPNVSLSHLLAGTDISQQRLAFEELLAHRLSLLLLRKKALKNKSYHLEAKTIQIGNLNSRFGFLLTNSQEKVIAEIYADISTSTPMMRLLQGDVGSGKTAVAACAILAGVKSGHQTAIMAPTEILAEQHYTTMSNWFSEDQYNCVLITGRDKGKHRVKKLTDIKNGANNIIIGTHALFQEDIRFKSLALIIVDEQHRFGVHQRLLLHEKGRSNNRVAHQLIMTATPIPRSLAMTAYADLDYSVISELPPGRKDVNTVMVSDKRRKEVITRVEKSCMKGEQAYWVCTLIEESETLQCQTVEETAVLLQELLPDLTVALVHGRLQKKDKIDVMQRFKNKKIDVLVATTVIEVGVDVANASLMIIENAERLGLSQLHQLRGRVGRGNNQSSCVLMYKHPLSELGKTRLATIRKHNSGFEIARQDLYLRGPGEVLGTKQTGLMRFRVADLVRDEHLLTDIKRAASYILQQHPENIEYLKQRWLGETEQFSNV